MLLSFYNLTVSLKTDGRRILDDVSLKVYPGEIVALVGGSGSGKTTVGMAAMRLLSPALAIDSGQVLWKGEDIAGFTPREIRRLRGGEMSMIFQEPLNAFNPLLRIRHQIDEVLRGHTDLQKLQRYGRIARVLEQAGVPDSERVMMCYPHQLSGGLRQRAMIAQALAAEPKLIIADEPTSSVDVTTQARIADVFRHLRRRLNLSILLITHDLGLVRHLADRVYVLNQGRLVESGQVAEVLGAPQHAYTRALIQAADAS